MTTEVLQWVDHTSKDSNGIKMFSLALFVMGIYADNQISFPYK